MDNENLSGNTAEEQYADTTGKHATVVAAENSGFIKGTPNIRLLESFRDMGYTNYSAMKDLIDNSVDALIKDGKNPFIKILTKFSNKGKGTITIIDNGIGMTKEILEEALLLGSNTGKERNGQLGFFGIGLNGASISMGRGFKVITKQKGDIYYTGIYDLDIAVKLQSWDFPIVKPSTLDEIEYFEELTDKAVSGTVLEIYKLDRISNSNKTTFDEILLKDIAMTYRYYISGKDNVKKIKFFLNGKEIHAIDPMGVSLPKTKLLNPGVDGQKYQFEVDGRLAEVVVRYYYVSDAIETQYPGSKNISISPRTSGFYIMRNHREIMSAEKLGFTMISKITGFNSNFRAEFLFDGKYDEILKTNIMKNAIIPPQSLLDKMTKDVRDAIKQCQDEMERNPKEKKSKVEDFEEVNKDIASIAKEINDNKNTPTILTDKNGNPIKKEEVEELPEPLKDPKEPRDRKEETEPRQPKVPKKITIELVSYGKDSSFFISHHLGNGKYLFRINIDHGFFNEYKSLNRHGKKLIIDLLYSFTIASRNEIYSEDLSQIEELIFSWSTYLRRILKDEEV